MSTAPPAALASDARTDTDKVLNVYNWVDYIAPSVITDFEQEYGIRVNYDVYDSNEALETKLLVGHSNYDVVVPSGAFLERQIKAGVYQKLDRSRLANFNNLDPETLQSLALYDPGNQYAIAYMESTTGIGYDAAKIQARMPDAALDSWRILFDPVLIARFKDCGVSMLDAPVDVVSSVLFYLHKDPNSESLADLKRAEDVLLAVRPYVRTVNSAKYVNDMASGDICLALGWSGDVSLARDRAAQAGKRFDLRYSVPLEGAISIFDTVAIPADAPHPRNAHLFLDYLMRPDVAAANSNAVKYASGVAAASALINPELRQDSGVYPPPQVRARLVPVRAHSQDFTRQLMRSWARFKTGR